MALPGTAYEKASRLAIGTLTDFTVLIDLASMSLAWWALVDTTDPTRGRAAKDDETELATDWMLFNDVAKTGWVRVKWSGVYSAAGINTIRMYPPVLANAPYAPGDTFGSHAAYDSNWLLYLELDEVANNDVNGYKDRISGNNHGQGESMALPAVAGQVGDAQDFDGSADSITVSDSPTLQIDSSDITVVMWEKHDTAANQPLSKWDGSGIQFVFLIAGGTMRFYSGGLGSQNYASSTAVGTGTWRQVIGTHSSPVGGTSIYVDAVKGASAAVALAPPAGSSDIHLAKRFNDTTYFNGQLDGVQLHDVARSPDWIAEEFTATDDNVVYWGVWTHVPGGATVSFAATFQAVLVNTAAAQKRASFTATLAAVFVNTASGQKRVAMAAVLAAAFENEAVARKETGLAMTLDAITLDAAITAKPNRRT